LAVLWNFKELQGFQINLMASKFFTAAGSFSAAFPPPPRRYSAALRQRCGGGLRVRSVQQGMGRVHCEQ
jgi:hypothetical protein